jgi:hypothetical protein
MNIMWDPRVHRGTNFGTAVLTPAQQAEMERLQREEEERKRRRERAKRAKAADGARAHTPEAVDGRSHAGAQTDEYLEAISDRPLEEDAGVQTEVAQDRPPVALFVPHKSGVDVGTEIGAGELFDFDFEVEPVLEVLVGKSLEYGLMEVLEEEELAAVRRHQEEFEQLRAAELAEVQRLEAEARRKAEEKRRRMQQEASRLRREAQAKDKVAAAAFAHQYVGQVRSSVFEALQRSGAFFDPLVREIETKFLPGVADAAAARIDQRTLAQRIADDLIQHALRIQREQRAAEAHRLRLEREERERREAEERARREEEERRRKEELRRKLEEEQAAAEGGDAAEPEE